MTALTPDLSALWRTAGTRIAAAGLPPDLPHRSERVLMAGALAAAQAQAYATETNLSKHLAFELLEGDALTAYGALDRTELLSVEMTVARCWRRIAVEVGRLRGATEVAA